MPRAAIDNGQPLHLKTNEAWQALIAANNERFPKMMVRGNSLTYMGGLGYLIDWGLDALRDYLSEIAQFFKYDAHGNVINMDPPKDVVTVLLNRDEAKYSDAPRVERVVDVPVLGRSGKLLTEPGHQEEDELYYRPAEGMETVRPAAVDSIDDVAAARDYLLGDLLGDFDFAENADRAHALALLLLPFVREFIGGHPTPMHAIFAPEYGAGKTTLARTALYPGCGDVPMSPGGGGNEEEWRKQITSLLLAAVPAIVFDNLAGTLNTQALASAITTGNWSDRILGRSQLVQLPVRNAWVATGNNLDLADEQVRRIVPIFLAPGPVTAAEKSPAEYRHPDLLGWAAANRPRLASAALTLVRHWVAGPSLADVAGFFSRDVDSGPIAGGRTLGSFTRWGQVMGGILDAADVPGFLENTERLRVEANESGREAANFFATWHDYTEEGLTIRKILECATTPDNPIRESLPTDLAVVSSNPERLHRKLSIWLREHNGRKLGGLQLIATEERRRLWSVRKVA